MFKSDNWPLDDEEDDDEILPEEPYDGAVAAESEGTLDTTELVALFPVHLQIFVHAGLTGNVGTELIKLEPASRREVVEQIVAEIEQLHKFARNQQTLLWQQVVTPSYLYLGDNLEISEEEPTPDSLTRVELIEKIIDLIGLKSSQRKGAKLVLNSAYNAAVSSGHTYAIRKATQDKIKQLLVKLYFTAELTSVEHVVLEFLLSYVPADEQKKLLNRES